MAFAASTVKTRYQAAGNIPILKSDFVNICNDLLTLETFAATASDQAGKFTKILLAGASAGASSLLSGGAVSELGTTVPATNIPLHHLDVGSLAATATSNRGRWKQLLLAETAGGFPHTNIELRDVSAPTHIETSANGEWRRVSLANSVLGSAAAHGASITNIGLMHLKGAQLQVNGNTVVTVSGADGVIRMTSLGTGPATSAGTFKYFLMSSFITNTVTDAASVLWLCGLGGNKGSGTANDTNYHVMMVFNASTSPLGGTNAQSTFQVRMLEIAEA